MVLVRRRRYWGIVYGCLIEDFIAKKIAAIFSIESEYVLELAYAPTFQFFDFFFFNLNIRIKI